MNASLLFIGAVLAAFPQVSQLDWGSESLRGLPGLAVLAEDTSRDIAKYGVTAEWLAARVEREMARVGVPAIGRADALTSARQPLLVVRLQSVRTQGTVFAWHLSLAVHQRLVAQDSTGTLMAQTWAARAVLGATSGVNLRESVSESLDGCVEELGKAWKAR